MEDLHPPLPKAKLTGVGIYGIYIYIYIYMAYGIYRRGKASGESRRRGAVVMRQQTKKKDKTIYL